MLYWDLVDAYVRDYPTLFYGDPADARTDRRVAADDEERALLWKGRKTAFGAIAQLAPDYYLHDTVVQDALRVQTMTSVVDALLGYSGLAMLVEEMELKSADGIGTLALRIEDGGVTETAAKTLPIVLRRVDLALDRIESGVFGVCVECGKKVQLGRLDAVPWARHCIDCQELQDQGEL